MSDDFSLFSTLLYDPYLRQVHEDGPSHSGWNFQNKSPVYLLNYHRDRLLKAATHWNWINAIDKLRGETGLHDLARGLDEFVAASSSSSTDTTTRWEDAVSVPAALRMRIIVSRQGDIRFDCAKCPRAAFQTLFPTALTAPNVASKTGEALRQDDAFEVVLDSNPSEKTEYTHFKTTMRSAYNEARQRAGISLGDTKEVLMVNDKGLVMEGSITTPYFWRGGRWVTPPVSAGYGLDSGDGGNDGVSRRWALERGLVVEESVAADSLQQGEECWLSNGAKGFIFARVHL